MNNLLIVISGPSGSGKGETIKRILKKRKDFKRISTYTTRKPRQDEKNGEQYNFISVEDYFKLFDNKKLMSCSRIEDVYYGAPIIDDSIFERDNEKVLIDIGVSGGMEIKKRYPEVIMIYLIPETEKQLLTQRGDRGKTRQARGIKQIQDILSSDTYEWLVKNGNIEDTIKKIELIIDFIYQKRTIGLSEKEEKMYNRILEEFSIKSTKNRKFLEDFYKIDGEVR